MLGKLPKAVYIGMYMLQLLAVFGGGSNLGALPGTP